MFTSTEFIMFLSSWQTLIGSMIGAAVPFTIWIFSEWYKSYSVRKEHLRVLNKIIGLNIVSVVDAHVTIKKFLDEKIPKLLTNLQQVSANEYFLGTAFFPIFYVEPIKVEVMEINTGSGYVDSQILQVVKTSRDLASSIEDIRRQFDKTIDEQKELCLIKVNSPTYQNKQFELHVNNFKDVIREEMLVQNIPLYVRQLAIAQVSIDTLYNMGVWRWKIKFGSFFKYFLKKEYYLKHKAITHERISLILNDKIDLRIKEIEKEYLN